MFSWMLHIPIGHYITFIHTLRHSKEQVIIFLHMATPYRALHHIYSYIRTLQMPIHNFSCTQQHYRALHHIYFHSGTIYRAINHYFLHKAKKIRELNYFFSHRSTLGGISSCFLIYKDTRMHNSCGLQGTASHFLTNSGFLEGISSLLLLQNGMPSCILAFLHPRGHYIIFFYSQWNRLDAKSVSP